jgi:hypothetical protein
MAAVTLDANALPATGLPLRVTTAIPSTIKDQQGNKVLRCIRTDEVDGKQDKD